MSGCQGRRRREVLSSQIIAEVKLVAQPVGECLSSPQIWLETVSKKRTRKDGRKHVYTFPYEYT